ncbi:MAG TPA: M14 family metallopeptidase [Bacteroidia bacterium]|nr:M14 family metallopeptidase [Bacteroidia bacterium]HRS57820.1 M14 family metallopeptidase [Bacteroidia bacterium]HRU67880.1 M14 family metallopeptidase [Bacteroidia bacterium]
MRLFLQSFFAFSIILGSFSAFSQKEDWQTFYEKSGFKATPRYDETIEFCKRLDKASDWVYFTSFGKSPEGRDLPLLIIDRDGMKKPLEVKQTEKIIVLIQAGIHAGEIDGKDAGLVLFRDMVIDKKYSELLKNVTILFIPILNVDGHEHFGKFNRINQNGPEEMGFRTNATNLNLNRDYLKADAPEIQAWHSLFNEWLPDFFIDIHSTDGADYQYVLTYHLEIFGNMKESLTDWQKNVFLKYVSDKMEKDKIPIFPYVIFRKWHDPRSGLISWVGSPVLSHGYTALQNRPGLLIENHMLKDYKTRVDATISMLKYTLEVLNKESRNLKNLLREADFYVGSKSFMQSKYILKWTPSSDSTIVSFKGFDYEVVKSDLSGGDWFRYSNKPKEFKIPYFNRQLPSVMIDLPAAYIIPPQWQEVIKRLEILGVRMDYLSQSAKIKVELYRLNNPEFSNKPYEGRQTVTRFDLSSSTEVVTFPKGSAIIRLRQPSAQVAIHALEPQGPSSYVFWGFFNSIFEQKEYSESYVMEKLAREMLAKDENLKKEFQEKMKDEKFAGNSFEILNWFYSKSPYWDNRIGLYPVGRIMDEEILTGLPFK